MVATLARSGNNSYSLGNQRSFDAWGTVRLGAQNGDPSGRYCAQLGHKQDDESGLIYMRARYYEPASGRFMCEDWARDGVNWFTYCHNDPANMVDSSGRDINPLAAAGAASMLNSIIGQIFTMLRSIGVTFSGQAGTELMLKISGAALTILSYTRAIQSLEMTAVLAEYTFDLAMLFGCTAVAESAESTMTGCKVGICFLRAMIAVTMYNVGMEVWVYLATNPDDL